MESILQFVKENWLLVVIGLGVLALAFRAMKINSKENASEHSAQEPEIQRDDGFTGVIPSAAANDRTVSKIESLEKKLAKLQARFQSVEYAIAQFSDPDSNLSALSKTVKDVAADDSYSPVVSVDLQALSVPELKKLFTKNQQEITALCKSYESKYTTKANAMNYRLMVLALEAELQNILTELRFGKLENGIAHVRELTSKYYAIVEEGNQTIAPSIKRFVGQLEYFYIEAVKIEYEYYIKQEQRRAEQKAIREKARQDAADRRANEAIRQKLDAEAKKYDAEIQRLTDAIEAAEAGTSEYAALTDQLSKVMTLKGEVEEKQDEIANLLNGKAGTIYVISNIGAFGEDVFKVGMTRRLEPQERIDELSGASVPFPFDVHCMIFSEDAPALETKMHHRLDSMRVNKVNLRKEFFHVTLDEIERIVHEEDPTAEFHRLVPAEQYNQSQSVA